MTYLDCATLIPDDFENQIERNLMKARRKFVKNIVKLIRNRSKKGYISCKVRVSEHFLPYWEDTESFIQIFEDKGIVCTYLNSHSNAKPLFMFEWD